ncbi:hypothetical protein JCM30237_24550 [Halolamina litorea]|nr:hypothetical protein [Halolamina litorea]
MGTTASDDGWDWEFSPRAETQFSQIGSESQQRIIDKLEEVVDSEWRNPGDFLEPLTNSPFQKLRVGSHRLGCRLDRESGVLRVESVRKREGAYKGDDWVGSAPPTPLLVLAVEPPALEQHVRPVVDVEELHGDA